MKIIQNPKWFSLVVLFGLLGGIPSLWAVDTEETTSTETVKYSTTPIGSSFLRHYAHRYELDLTTLVKFERRGFGRSEIITLVEISTHTGLNIKEYGKRRLKNDVTLKELAEESGLNFDAVYKKAGKIKMEIEALGDQNLPPPVFEKVKDDEHSRRKKKKKKKNKLKSENNDADSDS